MEDRAAASGQVYLSSWPTRLVTSRLLPRPLLVAIARTVVGLLRRRIHKRDRIEAGSVAVSAAHAEPVLCFADIYHGGATFWDWVVLPGGGLWWEVLWPLVITTSGERLATYPELRTVLELDAHTYEEMEERRPADIAALRAAIAVGRMEIVNGTYAQPLAQTIGAEANIRHFYCGLSAIERILGTQVHSFVAGEPQFFPQLPQVLASVGIRNVVFRTHWAPFGTDPAADADIVRWGGPDGSVVRTVPRYGCMDYSYQAADHPGVQNAGLVGDDFEQWPAERTDEFIAEATRCGIRHPFITRLADPKPPESPFPGILAAARRPRSRIVTVKEYCELPRQEEPAVSYTVDDIPNTIPWGLAGEQLHREQVAAETAVLLAERLDAIAQRTGAAGRQARLDAAWKLLLRAQHHDLHLCSPWHSAQHGMSMGEIGCDFARRSVEQVQAVTTAALGALAERFRPDTSEGRAFLLFNPSPWRRRELVQLPAHAGIGEVCHHGTRLATQTTFGEHEPAVAFVVELPPLGVDIVEVRTAQAAVNKQAPVALAPDIDVIARELASGLITGGSLTVWKHDQVQRSEIEGIQLKADGPLFRRYRVSGRLGDLRFVQLLTVIPALQRIQVSTEIDFGRGQHPGPQMADHRADLAYYIQDDKKLCLSFESPSPQIFCDSPFLLVEPAGPRITALSFLGVEPPEHPGVAILHKGTPGWHVDRERGVIRNVLAWGPVRWLYASDDSITPGWSRYTAVRGTHCYEHGIAVVTNRLDAVRAAHDFRLPVLAVEVSGTAGGNPVPWSFLGVAPEQVVLTALFARDGRTYARLWNAGNQPADVTLTGVDASVVSLRLTPAPSSLWPTMPPWGIQTVVMNLRFPLIP